MALVSPDVLTPADLLAMHVGVLRLYDGDEVQPEPGAHEPDVTTPADGADEPQEVMVEQFDPSAFEPDEPIVAEAAAAGCEIDLATAEGIREAMLWIRAINAADGGIPITYSWPDADPLFHPETPPKPNSSPTAIDRIPRLW